MSHQEKKSYLEEITYRYHFGSRQEKKRILDEFCLVCHYNRKYAIRLLNKGNVPVTPKPRGRRPLYHDKALLTHLRALWLATDMMCGKRLKQALPFWLPYYRNPANPLPQSIKEKLLAMSPATIDRLLKNEKKNKKQHGLSGTRPGYLLKTQIEIKTDHWDVTQPGFVEADTVAHCGMSLTGDFAWSITLVDIHTGWTEIRATWNKGAEGVLNQIKSMEAVFPFSLQGFDCDNGSEFLNYHLLNYLQKRKKPIQFTRSRPYKKNDNAHVEQKNWTGVRHVFGYYRLDKAYMIELMNDIYSQEWSLLLNYFYPAMKLIKKVKINSKYRRYHDKPQTPVERLLKSDAISEEKKAILKKKLNTLNPFELRKSLNKKLKDFFAPIDLHSNKNRRI